MLLGYVSKEWDILQAKEYAYFSSGLRQNMQWESSFIGAMWEFTCHLWSHRNTILHHTENETTIAKEMNKETMRNLFTYAKHHTLPQAQFLFKKSDTILIQKKTHMLVSFALNSDS